MKKIKITLFFILAMLNVAMAGRIYVDSSATAGSNKIQMITVFEPRIIPELSKRKPLFSFSKDVKKPYFIAKTLDFVDELNFQDGDGDCGFY